MDRFVWNEEEHAEHFPQLYINQAKDAEKKAEKLKAEKQENYDEKRSIERSRENLYRGGEEEAGSCEE